MKVAGYLGAVCAVIGAVFPSFTVIVIIAAFFPHLQPGNKILLGAFAGVRACIAGLIMVTAYRMLKRSFKNVLEAAFIILCLVLLISRVNPAFIIIGAMPLGCLYVAWTDRRLKNAEKNLVSASNANGPNEESTAEGKGGEK